MLLALVLEFDSHRWEILNSFAKSENMKDRLLRSPINSSVRRYNSTRVDEERKCSVLLAMKIKTCTVVGRVEEGPLCDPGSGLLLGGRARGSSTRIINGTKKKKGYLSRSLQV